MAESGIAIPTHVENFVVDLEESAKTGILVASGDALVGVLGVADPLKREAAVVIEGLKKMGIRPVMVTGDNWRTARAVAKEVRRDHSTIQGFKCICRSLRTWCIIHMNSSYFSLTTQYVPIFWLDLLKAFKRFDMDNLALCYFSFRFDI